MKKLILAVSFCLLSFNCTVIINNNDNDDSNNNDNNDPVIMPLNVGNGWIYEYIMTYEGQYSSELDTLTIVGTYEPAGFLWYQIGDPGDESSNNLIRNDSEGLWLGNLPNEYFNLNPILWAKYPTDTGENFNEVYVNGILESYSTCFSTKINFENYENCYAYKHINSKHFSDDWIYYFKPNIGWVGCDIENDDESYNFKIVLIDYNIIE